MELTLTAQLLGDLIEKGYTHVLAKTIPASEEIVSIIMKPVRTVPDLQHLPEGYETYYLITREPLQMACGVDRTNIVIDFSPDRNDAYVDDTDVLNDSYFRMDEDFFRQVLESLEDYAVITTDKKGDVNSWNTGAEKILGYKEKDIIGVNASIFFTDEDRERGEHIKELQTALKSGRAIDERFHKRKDGTTFWGSGLVFPLKDRYDQVRGFTKIMRRYDEEKRAKKESTGS